MALGQILRERDLITQEQLTIAIDRQRSSNLRLGQVLLDLGYTPENALLGALTIQLGVPAARLDDFTIHAKAVHALSEKFTRKHNGPSIACIRSSASRNARNALGGLRGFKTSQ